VQGSNGQLKYLQRKKYVRQKISNSSKSNLRGYENKETIQNINCVQCVHAHVRVCERTHPPRVPVSVVLRARLKSGDVGGSNQREKGWGKRE
jgi:hypothetical protein